MLSIYRLASNTLKECLREPVFYLILVVTVTLIGLFPSLALFVFRKQIKLVADSSIAITMVSGLFLAVLSAGHTIRREMKNGTVLLLMSKPVSRYSFVIAKVLGILSALSVYLVVCCGATVISLLVAKDQFQLDYKAMTAFYAALILCTGYGGLRNYLSQKSFSSHASAAMLIVFPVLAAVLYAIRVYTAEHLDPEEFVQFSMLLPILFLLFPSVWLMGAVSAALAIRLDFVANLLICLSVFLLGLVARYFLFQWLGDSFSGKLLGAILPNWQLFWMADALTNLVQVPLSYVMWSLLYVLCHITGWTMWAVFLFQEDELARDSR